MEKPSSYDGRFWEFNARWNPVPGHPVLVPSGKPNLMDVLCGTHEDFRSDGPVARFRVVMPRRDRTGPELSAYIHSLLEVEMYDWWWWEIDEATVAVSFRLNEIKTWQIRGCAHRAIGTK